MKSEEKNLLHLVHEYGNVQSIKFISSLPDNNFSEEYNLDLYWLNKNGHKEVVELLKLIGYNI